MSQYSDIDLNFNIHPVKKDLSKKIDEEAVKQSLKILILSNFYERPFQSDLGSGLSGLLFDNITPLTKIKLEDAIREVINNYEPRAELLGIEVIDDGNRNSVSVTILFQMQNLENPIELNLLLERLR